MPRPAAALAAALAALAGLPLGASLRSPSPESLPADGAGSSAELAKRCAALREAILVRLGPKDAKGKEDYLQLYQTDQHVYRNEASFTEEEERADVTDFLTVGDADVAVARYKEDTSWTKPLQEKGLNVTVRKAEGVDETIAFAKQLLDSYDSNRSLSVYLHGNAPEDWHSPDGLLDYIMEIDPVKLNRLGGYASLNHPYLGQANNSQHKLLEYRMECSWKDDLWVKMMKSRWSLPVGAFSGRAGRYCCSQFVLTRQALRSYPKAFYSSLLERVSKVEPWNHRSWKTIGRTMAMLWHVMFTGKVEEPKYGYAAIARCPPSGCHGRRPRRG